MQKIIYSKRFCTVFGIILLLNFHILQGSQHHIQNCFDEYESKLDIINQYQLNHNYIENQESHFFVKRSGELMIPANGNCLFTSVLLGYLLPVLENQKELSKRSIRALGKCPNHLWNQLKIASSATYFEIIEGFLFKNTVSIFKNNMGIQAIRWGGVEEMKVLCNKLGIAIEIYIPDPEKNHQELIGIPEIIKPEKKQTIVATIGIVQDVASSREKSYDQDSSLAYTFMVSQSIQEQVYSHHFRLKINNHLTIPSKNQANHHQPPIHLNKELMSSAYMVELQNLNLLPDHPKLKELDLQSDSISLEKILNILINSLRKAANLKRLDFNNQEKKPDIQDYSMGNEGGDQDISSELPLLCNRIEQYAKEYLSSSDLKIKINLRMRHIKEAIKKKHFAIASSEAYKTLRLIQPVNIEKTLFYAQKAEEASTFIEGKDIILFIGSTGVGKSTTLLYLMGCKMKKIIQNDVNHIKADKESISKKYQNAIANITTSPLPRSETHYITGVTLDLSDLKGNADDDDSDSYFNEENPDSGEIVLCDTPGFEDTSGAEVDIANGTGVIHAIKKAQSVRIALLFSTGSLYEERMQSVTKILSLIGRMMPNFIKYKRAFSYLFTKANNDTRDEIHALFDNLLTTEKNDKIVLYKSTKNILKDIHKRTKRNTLVVDPTESMSETVKRKKLLDVLLKSKKVKNPKNAFLSYLTRESEEKLMKQLRYHQYAIKVAIMKHNFSLASYKLEQIYQVKKLFQSHRMIDNTYIDVVEEAKKKWNAIGEACMAKFEKEVLSYELLDDNVIDEYLKINSLYTHFDKTLRRSHFPQNSIQSESLNIKLKKVLVNLRITILDHSLTEPGKTSTYLAKLKQLAKKINNCTPFLEKTYQLLSKKVTKKEEEFSNLVAKKQLKEASAPLLCIHRAQVLQKELNTSILDIEKTYHKMISVFLAPLEDALKDTYKILGKKYIKREENWQIIEQYQHSDSYNFNSFSLYKVNKLKEHYKLIQKAFTAFQYNQLLPITQTINHLYEDYIKQSIAFIKKATPYTIQLLKSKQGSDAEKAHKIIPCIRAFREIIDEITKQTYHEQEQIEKVINNQFQTDKKETKKLLTRIFNNKDSKEENANRLALYVNNILNSPLLTQYEKEGRLKEIEKELTAFLRIAYKKSKYLDLSLDYPDDFTQVDKIMNSLESLNLAKVGDTFKCIAKYESHILKQIKQQVISVLSPLEANFDERRTDLQKQKKLLKLLQEHRGYIHQDQALEKEFQQKCKNLSQGIVSQKKLKEAISSLNKDIFNKKKASQEYQEKLVVDIQYINEKLIYLNKFTIPKTNNNHNLTEHEYTAKLNKIITQETHGAIKNIEEALKLQKEQLNLKKQLEQKINDKKKETVNAIEKIKKDKKRYEAISSDYQERKKEIKDNREASIEAISYTFLTSDKVQDLRDEKIDLLNDYIEELTNQIEQSELQQEKKEKVWPTLDTDLMVAALKYLQKAREVEWIEEDYHDVLENNCNGIYTILQMDFRILKNYLKKYVKIRRNNITSILDTLRQNSELEYNDEHKDSEVVDCKVQLKDIKQLYKHFKEIDNWKRFYQRELFDPYFPPYFMSQCEMMMEEIVNQLEENSSLILRQGNLKQIMNQSKIIKAISKIDYFWDKEEKKATKLCIKYEEKIKEKMNDEPILQKVESREYNLVNKELKKLLKNIKQVDGNDYSIKRKVANIQTTLSISIIELINEIDYLFFDKIVQSINNELNNHHVQDILRLNKELSTAKRLFFKDEESFLKDSRNEIEEKINQLKQKAKTWIHDRKRLIGQNISKNMFFKAQKSAQLLEKVKILFKNSELLSSQAFEYNFDKKLEERMSTLKKKFHIDSSSNEKSLENLVSVHEQLKMIGREKEAQNILIKVESEYQEYLKNIEYDNNMLEDTKKQEEKLILAGKMLNSMPRALKVKLEKLYKQKVKTYEETKREFDKQLQEIQNSYHAEEYIELWNTYKNSSSQRVLDKIINNINSHIKKTNKLFINALEKKQLTSAYQASEELKKYQRQLSMKDFPSIQEISNQTTQKVLYSGNEVIEEVNQQLDKVEEEPERIHNIITQFKELKNYSNMLLKE